MHYDSQKSLLALLAVVRTKQKVTTKGRVKWIVTDSNIPNTCLTIYF